MRNFLPFCKALIYAMFKIGLILWQGRSAGVETSGIPCRRRPVRNPKAIKWIRGQAAKLVLAVWGLSRQILQAFSHGPPDLP